MPPLGSSQTAPLVKVLIVANSGFGKTGGLASLAAGGYKLHIADYDNGVPILLSTLSKDYWKNVKYETFIDKFKKLGPNFIPLSATAWDAGNTQLEKWANANSGEEHVLVVDSLTHMCNSALRHTLHMNKRLGMQPFQSDWGDAQGKIEGVLSWLYSSDVKCNVVVNAHALYLGGKDNPDEPDNATNTRPIKGYPMSLGKALSPKIGSYFNNMLVGKVMGEGASAVRSYFTNPIDLLDAKTMAPGKVKDKYPLTTGLRDFFSDVRGSVLKT